MALTPGTRLGPYEIASPIGAGGMGEVYRAIDTTLKRAVAIKVLPDALAADAERLARLQREAEVLASLNHAHIEQIMVVSYRVEGSAFQRDPPREWSKTRYLLRGPQRSFDLHPDGNRMVMAVATTTQDSVKRDKLILVFNFFDELRRLVPVPGK